MKNYSLSKIYKCLALSLSLCLGLASCTSDEPSVPQWTITDIDGKVITVESESSNLKVGDKAYPDGIYSMTNGDKIVVSDSTLKYIRKGNEVANRTLLVYMIASNTLNGYDRNDIKEMQQICHDGVLDGNRLLIYHQTYEKQATLKEIMPYTDQIDTLKVYDSSVSSLSSVRMDEVIADMKNMAKANDYGLVLWSHANGWIVVSDANSGESSIKSSNNQSLVSTLAFGEDKSQGTTYYMNTSVLGNTLRGKGLSFIFFDCCYMGSVEVFYDMRGTAPLVGASAAEIIAEGMPYHLTLPYFFRQGEADFIGAVNADFQYVDAKTDLNRTGTFSIVDMTKMDELAEACRDFYSFHPVTHESFEPQRFMYERTCYHYDLAHLIENYNLPEGADEETLASFEKARGRALNAIEAAVVYKANTPYIWPNDPIGQVKLDHHCGLSTYFLRSEADALSRNYSDTNWWKDASHRLFH